MPDESSDRLLEHDYDGIQEYDNPMPRWWLWIFYATIIFVPLYYVLPLPFGEGPGAVAEYEAEVAAQAARTPPVAAVADTLTDHDLHELSERADVRAAGKLVFETSCAACHRADAGGLIGPNLTDDAWIHGGAPSAVRTTIATGVLAKGMPAWDRILKPEQLNAVTAYVLSLRGTNPPSPKAPEGTVDTTSR